MVVRFFFFYDFCTAKCALVRIWEVVLEVEGNTEEHISLETVQFPLNIDVVRDNRRENKRIFGYDSAQYDCPL